MKMKIISSISFAYIFLNRIKRFQAGESNNYFRHFLYLAGENLN